MTLRQSRAAVVAALLLTGVLLAGCVSGAAATREESLPQSLDRIVQTWHERAWVPGVAVSVRRGTSFAWSGAAGYADEATEAPMHPDIPFYIASVTKPFVAVTVLRLAEEDVVDLDETLDRYVPDFPNAAHVTIRQLLGMRSGIPDYTHSFGFVDGIEEDLRHRRTRHWSTQELLALAAQARPDFAPGRRFAYSNTNYILLSEVIEAATSRPWWQALEQQVLEPLGLEQTVMPTVDEVPTIASGHADLDRDATRDSLAGRPYGSVVTAAGAAGALVSTAEELTVFARDALGDGLLSEASLQEMTTVEHEGYEPQYGLGVFVHKPDLRTRVIGHTGGGIGYSSVLWYAPEHDLAIAVLVNDSVAEPEDLAELLLRQILRHDPA